MKPLLILSVLSVMSLPANAGSLSSAFLNTQQEFESKKKNAPALELQSKKIKQEPESDIAQIRLLVQQNKSRIPKHDPDKIFDEKYWEDVKAFRKASEKIYDLAWRMSKRGEVDEVIEAIRGLGALSKLNISYSSNLAASIMVITGSSKSQKVIRAGVEEIIKICHLQGHHVNADTIFGGWGPLHALDRVHSRVYMRSRYAHMREDEAERTAMQAQVDYIASAMLQLADKRAIENPKVTKEAYEFVKRYKIKIPQAIQNQHK